MLTLSVPAGCCSASAAWSTASASAVSGGPTCARRRCPPSVSVRLRVLRWNSRTPRLASSRATFLLTAAGVRPMSRAAAEKLPDWADCTNDSRWLRGCMRCIFNQGLKDIQPIHGYRSMSVFLTLQVFPVRWRTIFCMYLVGETTPCLLCLKHPRSLLLHRRAARWRARSRSSPAARAALARPSCGAWRATGRPWPSPTAAPQRLRRRWWRTLLRAAARPWPCRPTAPMPLPSRRRWTAPRASWAAWTSSSTTRASPSRVSSAALRWPTLTTRSTSTCAPCSWPPRPPCATWARAAPMAA